MKLQGKRGMTLVELIVGTLLLVGAGGALLIAMNLAMLHAEHLGLYHTAMNAVQGRLEQLSANPFVTLRDGAAFEPARTSQQIDPLNLPNGALTVQIRPAPGQPDPPTVLELHVAACWQHRGRLIGERAAGVCGDDADANWWVNSPTMVSTRIAMRD